jgi:hypothetical protein
MGWKWAEGPPNGRKGRFSGQPGLLELVKATAMLGIINLIAYETIASNKEALDYLSEK